MRLFIPALCLLLLFSCKKSDNNNNSTPQQTTPTLTLSTAEATPGDAIEVRVNRNSLAGEVNILFGSTTLKGYVKGDSSYVFMVPVVAPGTVAISIPSVVGSNTVNLTIKNYTPITDPQVVINDYIDKRNKAIDSVIKIQSVNGFQPSPETITLLNQLKEELDLQLTKIAAVDKEQVAYVLQKNLLDPPAYSMALLPPDAYAKLNGIQGDVGDYLVTIAKNYVTAHTICAASIPFLIGNGYLFLMAPNPISAAIFLATFTTFVISREVAIKRAQEVGRLKGVAEAVTTVDAQRIQAVDFYNNQEKSVSMSVSFRNLATADAAMNPDVNTAFIKEQAMVNKDKEVADLYASIKAKVSSWLSRLTGTYPAYSAVIGKTAQATMTQVIEGSKIVVKGVSDSRISFTTSLSGTMRSVKITSTATADINFTLTVAYKRTLDGVELTKDIPCTLKPERVGVTVISGIPGSISSMAIDAAGNIYIADWDNDRVQKWAPGATSGVTVAGGNGKGGAANQLDHPEGMFLDASGNLYIADYYNRRIQKWAPGATSGVMVAGGSNTYQDPNYMPSATGVFVDAAGNIYVTEEVESCVEKWSPGTNTRVVVAGKRLKSGDSSYLLDYPVASWVDAAGAVYVVDASNNRIQKWAKGASFGVTVAGGNGKGSAANQLYGPTNIYVDGSGNVYVADYSNSRVQKWAPGATSGVTVAGGNGSGSAANQFAGAHSVHVDAAGNIYVADYYNHRVQKWPPL